MAQGITKVTVESTSGYWQMWFYLLEARALDVQLANARNVKNCWPAAGRGADHRRCHGEGRSRPSSAARPP
jgi:transposase